MHGKNYTSLAGPELLLECGAHPHDSELWEVFYTRYRRKITKYALHALRSYGPPNDSTQVADLVQEVFLELFLHEARVMRSFRGNTELSVHAFLSRVTAYTIADHFRNARATRRHAPTVPVEPSAVILCKDDALQRNSLVSVMDIERALLRDSRRHNSQRDRWIFTLHFVEGYTAKEIAAFPETRLTVSGIDKAITRIRSRLIQMVA